MKHDSEYQALFFIDANTTKASNVKPNYGKGEHNMQVPRTVGSQIAQK